MRVHTLRMVGLALGAMAVLGLAVPGLAADSSYGLTDDEKAEGGWISLFNGEDIKEGWVVQGLEFTGPQIKKKKPADIELKLQFRSFDWWALITERKFKNFVLRFDIQFQKETSNSGILLRTPHEKIFEDEAYKFEVQLIGTPGDATKESSGAIFGVQAPTKNAIKGPGEWNSIEVMLQEPKLKVTINGEVVQDVDVTTVAGAPKLRPEGSIAFQYRQETGKCYYNNIRVKPLD